MNRRELYIVSYLENLTFVGRNIIYIGYDKDKAQELRDYYDYKNTKTKIDIFRECDITESEVKL